MIDLRKTGWILIQKAGAIIGKRRRINLIEGANITLTVTDSPINKRVDVTITGTGGGAGLNTLSGTADLTFTSEDNYAALTITSALITNANFKSITVIPQEATSTSLDDFTLNAVTFNIENIVDSTSFDIRANAVNNATGSYQIKYIILYS